MNRRLIGSDGKFADGEDEDNDQNVWGEDNDWDSDQGGEKILVMS